MLKNVMTLIFITVLMGYGNSATAAPNKVQRIISQSDNQPTPTKDKMVCEELRGYFLKNSVTFTDPCKHIVVNNQKDFDNYFGIARTMVNETDKVDFEKHSVIAIATKPSLVTHKIEIIYCDLDDSKLTVKYKISNGAENSFKSSGLLLATIPKNITHVIFTTRDNVESIDVK